MDIKMSKEGNIQIVNISGNVDGQTAPLATQQVLPLVQTGCKLVVDMSAVGFMSSAGLRMLLSLQRQVAAKGKLVLVGLSDQIKNTMLITGFLSLFTIGESLTEGLAIIN